MLYLQPHVIWRPSIGIFHTGTNKQGITNLSLGKLVDINDNDKKIKNIPILFIN